MAVTISDVMREVRNYFPSWEIKGDWQIQNGRLTPSELLLDGDWIAIRGSSRNDGIHQIQTDDNIAVIPDGRNEKWTGSVWLLAPPTDFLQLCAEIAAWDEQHPVMNIKKESFGEYAVEHAVDRNGLPIGWRDVFEASLCPWRKPWVMWE